MKNLQSNNINLKTFQIDNKITSNIKDENKNTIENKDI